MLKQYAQVEHNNHHHTNKELYILAFPTNDFHQEPGTNEEIKQKVIHLLNDEDDTFYETYKSNFILFQQSSLRDNPIYHHLHQVMPKAFVRHNFYKYLVGSDGQVVSFHTKKESLMDMEDKISELL